MPSINAIFQKTPSAKDIKSPEVLFEACWKVDLHLFSMMINPKVILFLGNGERLSAYAFLRKQSYYFQEKLSGGVRCFAKANHYLQILMNKKFGHLEFCIQAVFGFQKWPRQT